MDMIIDYGSAENCAAALAAMGGTWFGDPFVEGDLPDGSGRWCAAITGYVWTSDEDSSPALGYWGYLRINGNDPFQGGTAIPQGAVIYRQSDAPGGWSADGVTPGPPQIERVGTIA